MLLSSDFQTDPSRFSHSFGSAQSYALVNMYPDISDGLILTGFSTNSSFVGFFAAGANFVQANLNQPFRFGNPATSGAQAVLDTYGLANLVAGVNQSVIDAYELTDYVAALNPKMSSLNYPNGYLTNANVNAQQYLFFLPGFFDQGIAFAGEATKQPVTVGELLTLGSLPMVNAFKGPVLVFTGCGFSFSTPI